MITLNCYLELEGDKYDYLIIVIGNWRVINMITL